MEQVIIDRENFQVIRLGKSQFLIQFQYQSHKIVNSFIKTKLIPGSSTDENYKTIKFKAESVKSLAEFEKETFVKYGKKGIIVPTVAKMIYSLSNQLSYLIERERCTIIGYSVKNVIVINDDKFLFLDGEFIANIDEKTQQIMISYPFSKTEIFLSPELLTLCEIPAYVHYKTAYFSLACLLIWSITGENEFYLEFLKHKEPLKILEELENHPIKDTKMYWLLSRCLLNEERNRSILYI